MNIVKAKPEELTLGKKKLRYGRKYCNTVYAEE